MNKFFVDKNNINDGIAVIEGDDVKHIYKVLRLSEGEKVAINDCNGQEYLGTITEIAKKQVLVELTEKLDMNNESPVKFHLYQGLPKSTKMDLITQKCTELGVNAITPVITERVVVKGEMGEFKKVDRWARIALEACKQSKRSLVPKVNTPVEFQQMMREFEQMDLIVVPYENAEGYGVKSMAESLKKTGASIRNAAIVIGPEGGFEEREIEALKEAGAHVVTLGPRILRTETAGFVTLSLLGYEFGDLGGKAPSDA